MHARHEIYLVDQSKQLMIHSYDGKRTYNYYEVKGRSLQNRPCGDCISCGNIYIYI